MSFRLGDFKQRIDPSVLKREPGVRADGRSPAQLRPVRLTTGYLKHADGSCLVEVGDTRVVCAVSVEEKVPPFLKGKGEGWVTAEYGMLPRATTTRSQREATRGGASGRTHEIQRLIGRSLRAVVDAKALGERTLWVDCDVIQADGGTRCASITGAFVALVEALRKLRRTGPLPEVPVTDYVAAVSVGKVGEAILLDLNYEEDSSAHVDMNIVKTGRGLFVEVQGTAEGQPFSEDEMQGADGGRRQGHQGPRHPPEGRPRRLHAEGGPSAAVSTALSSRGKLLGVTGPPQASSSRQPARNSRSRAKALPAVAHPVLLFPRAPRRTSGRTAGRRRAGRSRSRSLPASRSAITPSTLSCTSNSSSAPRATATALVKRAPRRSTGRPRSFSRSRRLRSRSEAPSPPKRLE